MGFTPGQFRVGERVFVREDTRNGDYIMFAGLHGSIVEMNHNIRTWRKNTEGYDYSYRIDFDEPADDRLSEAQRRNLVRAGAVVWIPGRYLSPAASTMVARKSKGRWRNTDDDL